MTLRPSQVEVLKAVAKYEFHPDRECSGAPPARIAHAVGRKRGSVEESLAKLEEAGYVKAVFYPLLSAVYVLTARGQEALK